MCGNAIRTLLANSCFNASINLLLNILSAITLAFSAWQNIQSAQICSEEFNHVGGFIGRFYQVWIIIGAIVASILSVVNIPVIIMDAIDDFDFIDAMECETLRCASDLILKCKGVYSTVNSAIEPILLLYFKHGMSWELVAELSGVDREDMAGMAAITGIVINATASAATVRAAQSGSECVDDRFKVLASTGICALISSMQTSIRTYLKVGRILRDLLEDNGKYREAYEIAQRHFGQVGAIFVLMGFSDEPEDMQRILRAVSVQDPRVVEAMELAGMADDYAHHARHHLGYSGAF